MAESPTGRGIVQGPSYYTEADADELIDRAEEWIDEKRRREMALERTRRDSLCTCRGSESGMDVDRCPVHGIGCT
jgi:hypothetical protein